MEKRQRELRGNRPVPEDALSPSKRSRQEKENEVLATSSPQKQGFMAKFAVSPKNPRRDTAATLSQASPSTRARLNEVSKRYSEAISALVYLNFFDGQWCLNERESDIR